MPDVIEQLENWVKGHFEKKCNCKCLDNNPLDSFGRAYKCATCMAAFEVGKILGMDMSVLRGDNEEEQNTLRMR